MGESRITRYLLYALGEIILVVIGILIAIQLNDRQKEKEQELRQQKILSQLKSDLEDSRLGLRQAREEHRYRIKIANKITKAYWKPELQHDSLSVYFIEALNKREEYRPTLGTARSLINSGTIELINSLEVRSGVLAYIETVNAVLSDIESDEADYFRHHTKGMADHFDPSSFKRHYERTYNYDGHKATTGIKAPDPTPEDLALQPWPEDFKQVPFPVTTEELFTNQDIYSKYYGISIYHIKADNNYRNLLEATNSLIRVLDDNGF